jgi:mono/diheme cytochrome c family protein
MRASFLAFFLVATACWVALSAPVKITLPVETAVLKPGPGAELAAAHCLTCHSAEYISTQPVMPRAFWKASVDKMRAKFGAPITDDQMEKLTDYLVTAYGKADAVK